MMTARRQNGGRTYRCRQCFMQVAAEPLENLVAEAILYRLDRADLPSSSRSVRSGESIEALSSQLAQLATDHGDGTITRAEWMAARAALVARKEAAEAELARSAGTGALDGLTEPGAARKAWPEMPLERRQAVVDVWLDAVVIHPAKRRGPGLDPDRIDLRWSA